MNIQKIEDKYLLLAGLSDKFVKLTDSSLYTYYHFTIENGGNDNLRYGVWANGVLTETPCKNMFKSYNFELL